jgi:hypothetical protein
LKATYREADRVVEEQVGSPSRARDALWRMVRVDAVLLVLAYVALSSYALRIIDVME